MSTSTGSEGGARGPDPRKTQSIGGRAGGAADSAALPRILAETVDAFASADDGTPWHAVLTEEDRGRLLAVVRVRGVPAALDLATAADLVAAVLPRALAALADGPAAQRRLVERIAQSLLDDPQSALRLQSLFEALVAQARSPGGAP